MTFSDGTIYTGKVIGSDYHSDLAILLIDDVPKEKLFPLKLGNSSNLIVGETVAAVGNPFGLSGSLTEGIISGLGRLLPSTPENIFGNDNRVASFSIPDIIQTDAAINPGNSGGPLLNLNGEVIGINSAIFSNTGVYAGVGFAIPSNTLKKVIPELMKNGSYPHPWLGITGVDVTPDIAKKMNLTEARGFLVIDVNSNGPADKAGIRGGDKIDTIDGREVELGGDIILAIDGNPVRKIDDILSHLEREKSVGDNITLTIIRDGIVLEKTTVLQARPDSETLISSSQHPSLGITGIDVTPDIAKKMNLTEARGFLVIDVNSNGPADKAGIRGGDKIDMIDGREVELGGDIILAIDGKPVRKIDDVLSHLEREKSVGDKISLTVIRDGIVQEKNTTLEERPDSETLANSTRHPSLGITGIDVTPDIAKKMNLTEARGFLVIDVNSNGPADKAGIRGGYIVEIINNTQYRLGGDLIIGIDNQSVNSVSDITDYLKNKKEGDIVKLVILRNNEMINVQATLEIIQRPPNELDQIPPFDEHNPKDFDNSQGNFPEELKKECMRNFNENICNFLFK